MAGIYIHIPYCKQKCSYCDFHFSTQLNSKNELVNALCNELILRKDEKKETIETIYFGGGTPSLLSSNELNQLFETIYKHYTIVEKPEVTLETNPDDLTNEKVSFLKTTPVNRFSIGVQSFFDDDLKLMNRAHNAQQSINSIKLVQDFGFENITIDLIYGGQTTSDEIWEKNLEITLDLGVPHVSSYALTVEPKTLLAHQIQSKKIPNVDEEKQERQFRTLVKTLTDNQFVHYEISNFGKDGFLSVHNSNYWKGKPYLGIGPSAHSFNGKNRSWNVSNNAIYIKNIEQNIVPNSFEELSDVNMFNELIMIGLRTIYGVDLIQIKKQFPSVFYSDLLESSKRFLEDDLIQIKNDKICLTEKGKFLADGIASDLFRM
ncbi:MAG: radical SAM family heme chaperone HemW [Moheibacter sp.]